MQRAEETILWTPVFTGGCARGGNLSKVKQLIKDKVETTVQFFPFLAPKYLRGVFYSDSLGIIISLVSLSLAVAAAPGTRDRPVPA